MRATESLDPVGIWSCLVFGDPARGEERVVLLFASGGQSHSATQSANGITRFRPFGDWHRRGTKFSVIDPRTRRGYYAELDRPTLGGNWSQSGHGGGWWCARRPEPVEITVDNIDRARPEFFIPRLVPDVMASPRYPREAIQEAKEGRAIACFLVDPSGNVRDPEILELSDEIFRVPTLRAMERSRYRPSASDGVMRPGCRHFLYELRAID